MSEMVERVRQAIILADDTDGGPEDGVSYERMARAAIEAMREPTEGMVGAARLERDISYTTTRCIWRDMVDEALKG